MVRYLGWWRSTVYTIEGDDAFNVEFEFVDPNSGAQKETDDPGMVNIEDNDGEWWAPAASIIVEMSNRGS